MTFPRTVAIVGLGLMGGSLARDLAEAGVRVLAYDKRPEIPREALAGGIVSEILDDSLLGAREADMVIVATPVDQAIGILTLIARVVDDEALVTDVGSTKSEINAHAVRVGIGARFIGSHPLAGDHRSGWGAARRSLYHGVPVYLCPTEMTLPATTDRVERFWTALGASCTTLSASDHDLLMAWMSHLPQIASSAVAAALATSGNFPRQLGPGGRDVTRLASSSPEMWSAICLSNKAAIGEAVRALHDQLGAFDAALRRDDPDALRNFFRLGKDWLA